MNVEQIYTGCLAQGAYYIESNGEVAIIDPLREVQPYIEKATQQNAKIKYVFETHFHADFVSGHVTLSKATGAPIVYGPNANPSFDAIIAENGQEFQLGDITIVALHTPGHTMESTSYLLRDKDGNDHALFSGDTLFLGDVGRPDLAQKAGEITEKDLAGYLYDSLRNKIMPLADNVIVYPAHGAGSACGKNMMKETIDTLGNQKKTNYALRADMSKEEFISEVIDGLLPPPEYFPFNVRLNKEGYEDIDVVLNRGTKALSPKEFEAIANETGAIILDVRHKDDFVKGHIPRSIFIGLDGSFAPWVGALIPDLMQPILVVAPEGRNEETIKRLARVGYDNVIGYLEGGFGTWQQANKATDTVETIDVATFEKNFSNAADILDVRKPNEFASEHVENAQNFPLDFINSHMSEIDTNKTYYMHCRSGFRSTVAASILKARGFDKLINVQGKFDHIAASTIPTTDYICPSTLK